MSLDGYNLGTAFGRVVISDNVAEAVQTAQRSFDSAIGNIGASMQRFGDSLTGVGARMTALTAPIALFGASGINAAADFDVLMQQIESFGGVAGEELEAVRQYALTLGRDTAFSSQDAAAGLLDLLKAGQDLQQSMSTLPHVLDLATVGQISIAEAAGITSGALANFGLQAEDAARVSDALARAANASRADVRDLGEALDNGGNVANQYGLDIEQTAAVMGVFANAGIQGAEAGTRLKSMLSTMADNTPPVTRAWAALGTSLYDANGNLRDFDTVLDEVDTALDRLPVEEQNRLMQDLAGSYGITGLNALRAAGGIDGMLASMAEAPAAADLAAGFMDTFAGSMDSLKGSIETLQIEAFTPFMEDVLKPLVQRVTAVINKITEWATANPGLTKIIVSFGAALVVLGPTLIGLGLAISTTGTALKGLGLVFKGFTVGSLLPFVAAAGLVYLAFQTNFLGIRDIVNTVVERARIAFGMLEQAVGVFFEHLRQGESVFDALRYGFGEFVDNILRVLGLTREQSIAVQRVFFNIVDAVEVFTTRLRALATQMATVFNGAIDMFVALRETGMSVFAALGLTVIGYAASFGRALGMSEETAQAFSRSVTTTVMKVAQTFLRVRDVAGQFATQLREGFERAYREVRVFATGVRKLGVGEAIQNLFPPGVEKFIENAITGIRRAFDQFSKSLDLFQGDIRKYGIGEFIQNLFPPGIETLMEAAGSRIRAGLGNISKRFADFRLDIEKYGLGEAIFNLLPDGVQRVIGALAPMLSEIGEFLKNTIGRVIETVSGLFESADLSTFFENIDFSKIVEIGQIILGLTSPLGQVLTLFRLLDIDVIQIIEGIAGAITRFFGTLNDGGSLGDAFRAAFGTPDEIRENVAGFLSDIGVRIATFVQEAVAKVGELASGFIDWIAPMIPPLLEKLGELGQAFVDWVVATAPLVAEKLVELGGQILQWVSDFIPQAIAALLQLGAAFIDWIGPAIGELLPKLGEFLGTLIEWILGTAVPALVQAVIGLTTAIVGWIIDAIPQIAPALGEFLVSLGGFIINDLIPGVLEFAMGIGRGIIEGIIQGLGSIADFVWNSLISPLIGGIGANVGGGDLWGVVGALGSSILDGILQALGSIIEWVGTNIITPLVTAVGTIWGAISGGFDAIKNGIAGVFAWIRDNVIQPFIAVIQGIVGIAQGVADAVSGIIGGAQDAIATAENNAQMAGQIAGQLPQQIRERGIGGVLGVIGNAIGNEFRADGGPVTAGKAYIVGERGPEPFIPSTSGTIMSNEDFSRMMGGMGQEKAGVEMNFQPGSIVIQANSEAEGESAMRGVLNALEEKQRARGLV
jgi:TP901 family phage tail tape measure protein